MQAITEETTIVAPTDPTAPLATEPVPSEVENLRLAQLRLSSAYLKREKMLRLRTIIADLVEFLHLLKEPDEDPPREALVTRVVDKAISDTTYALGAELARSHQALSPYEAILDRRLPVRTTPAKRATAFLHAFEAIFARIAVKARSDQGQAIPSPVNA